MNYLIPIALLGSMTIIAFIFALNVSRNEALLRKRLNELDRDEYEGVETEEKLRRNIHELPLKDRVFYPYIKRSSDFMRKVTPKERIAMLDEKLMLAGNPKGMTGIDFLGIQGLIAMGLAFALAFFSLITGSALFDVLLAGVFGAGVGIVVPKFILGKKITERQNIILKNLPFALDLLTVSTDAGLGFDSAMDKVATNMTGPIAQEFERVLTAIRIGKPRTDALRDMVKRTEVKELSQFVVAIIQADKLGVGLSKLLKVQSKQMRLSAKQRAQEKAYKAPIKMLFPMILFIFPSIFVVLLGPALLYLPTVFGNL